MPPKKYRLKKEKDFEAVFKKGRLLQNNFFTIRFLKTKGAHNRFGIVVSAKVSKKAVERNRIKRIIWSFIGENFLFFKNVFDFVIVVKKSAVAEKKENFKEAIKDIFVKADLFVKI